MENLDIDEVSIVGRAANGTAFVIVKSDDTVPIADLPVKEQALAKSVPYTEPVVKADGQARTWGDFPFMPLWELPELVVPDLSVMKAHPIVLDNLGMMVEHCGAFLYSLKDGLAKAQADPEMIPEMSVFPSQLSDGLAAVGKAFGLLLDCHKGEHPGLAHGVAAAAPEQKGEAMAGLQAMLRDLLSKAETMADPEKQLLKSENAQAVGLLDSFVAVVKRLEIEKGQLLGQFDDAQQEIRRLEADVPTVRASRDTDDRVTQVKKGADTPEEGWPRDMNAADSDD